MPEKKEPTETPGQSGSTWGWGAGDHLPGPGALSPGTDPHLLPQFPGASRERCDNISWELCPFCDLGPRFYSSLTIFGHCHS